MVDKLTAAELTFKELQMRMADPEVAANSTEFQKVAKLAADLEETVNTFRAHKETEQQLADAEKYLKEEVGNDPEMAEFAKEEISELAASLARLYDKLKLMLLPRDPLDDKNIMLVRRMRVCVRGMRVCGACAAQHVMQMHACTHSMQSVRAWLVSTWHSA